MNGSSMVPQANPDPVSAVAGADTLATLEMYPGGSSPNDTLVIMQANTEVMQMIRALAFACRLTNLLDGRKNECHQNGNDCNHDEEFQSA